MAEADGSTPTGAAPASPPAGDADALGEATGSDAPDSVEAILQLTSAATGLDKGKTKIAQMQEQRRVLNAEKQALTRTIKNEARKRQRLLAKSSKLSVPDLVQTLYIRQQRAKATAARRAEAAGTAAPTP